MKVLSVNVGRLTQLPGVKEVGQTGIFKTPADGPVMVTTCLLYTSDAADERSSVDLGGRRIIKKKKQKTDGDVRYGKYRSV